MNHILTFHYFPWLSAGSPIVCHVVYSSFLMVCVELWTHVPWLSCTGNDSSFLLLKNVLRHGCKKDVGTPCIILMVLILATSVVNLIKELCMSFQIIPWCWVTWLWPSYESLGAVLVKGIWHSSCWLYHDSINIISCWLYTAYLTILCLPIALAIKVDQASYVLYALVNCITCFSNLICGVLLIIISRWLCN